MIEPELAPIPVVYSIFPLDAVCEDPLCTTTDPPTPISLPPAVISTFPPLPVKVVEATNEIEPELSVSESPLETKTWPEL